MTAVDQVAVGSYAEFVAAKKAFDTEHGFDVDDEQIHPLLKPHQRDLVRWAVRGGRRAIFGAFGIGKTVIELETIRLVTHRTGGPGLVVLPLGVRQEFAHDATMVGIESRFIRRAANWQAAVHSLRSGLRRPHTTSTASTAARCSGVNAIPWWPKHDPKRR